MDKKTLSRFLKHEAKERDALRRKMQRLQNPPPEESVFTWPALIKQVVAGAVVLTVLLTIASLVFDAPLEEIANHAHTPNPAKAPWYFVGLQELLVYFDPWLAGVVLPTLIIVGLILIPFVDTNLKGIGRFAPKERPFALGVFGFGMFLWFALIVFGLYFRGTNWDLYMPTDCWRGAQEPFIYRSCPDLEGGLAMMEGTLGSEMENEEGATFSSGAVFHLEPGEEGTGTAIGKSYVWRGGAWEELTPPPAIPLAWTPLKDVDGNTLAPDHPYHMAIGLVILGSWHIAFLVIPALLNPLFFRRLGLWRYGTAMLFTGMIFGVVGKILWRLIFGIKYILVTPWLNI
ncbi:hypothetical protein H8D30_00880 [bacterium]|nr:hypothetical protein [bacterium]